MIVQLCLFYCIWSLSQYHDEYQLNYFVMLCCITPAPAMINDPGMDSSVSVIETADISLSCTARGVPAPTITWSRDGVNLSGTENRITISFPMESTNDSTGFINVTSTLTVTDSMRSDANNYTCVASNTVQNSTQQDERTFTLTVNCKS